MKTTKRKKAAVTFIVPSIGWAISGIHMGVRYFYTGWWITRSEAIRSHCNDKFIIPSPKAGTVHEAWKICKAKGDKAVKVKIELF